MKISKIIIPAYRQFKNFELDLTYPEGHPKAGQPLDKVCLIGRNGTGKSTLLDIIRGEFPKAKDELVFLLVLLTVRKINVYSLHNTRNNTNHPHWQHSYMKEEVAKEENWLKRIDELIQRTYAKELHLVRGRDAIENFFFTTEEMTKLELEDIYNSLWIHAPAESKENKLIQLEDVPVTNLNEALQLKNNQSKRYEISNATVESFWKELIFSLNERKEQFDLFAAENEDKSYKTLKKEFDSKNPNILTELAALWNQILDKCGLYFDIENAKNPIQLTDNLHAYIKVKATNEPIPYHLLSTGIRNFIFRLGHIFSLFFNKEVDSGFLLVDEPENSLFPDFKRDLIQIYLDIIKGKNTQFFVATHDPIIASQFEPCERIILDFDEEGFVSNQSCRKGVAPEGDDANDILYRDFHTETMTHKGLEMWNLYLKKRKELRKTDNKIEKERLMAEISQLGSDYNFSE